MISLIWVGLHFWTQDGYRNVPYMWTTKCDFYMFSTLIYPCLCTLPRIWICSYGTVYQRRWTCVTFQQIFSQRSGRMLTARTCEGIDITIDANLLRAAFLWRQWLESKIGLDILTRKLISFWNGLFSKDTLIFGGVFGRLTATFGQFPSKRPWFPHDFIKKTRYADKSKDFHAAGSTSWQGHPAPRVDGPMDRWISQSWNAAFPGCSDNGSLDQCRHRAFGS